MRDTTGGYKALNSAQLRDRDEAATMVGRLHSAARAIELGYAIETDGGRSGRARDWRIVGIPAEVCEVFSKRSDQIADYLDEMGYTPYRPVSPPYRPELGISDRAVPPRPYQPGQVVHRPGPPSNRRRCGHGAARARSE